MVTKLHAGSSGRTSEYSVALIEDWDDPRFEQPLINYGGQWALESGLDVDPYAAELLYAAIGIPITEIASWRIWSGFRAIMIRLERY